MYVTQCRGEFERDRHQLQSQLDVLRRQLAESRDRRDVTAAECQQLADSLSVAEQSAVDCRQALREKVLSRYTLSVVHGRLVTRLEIPETSGNS